MKYTMATMYGSEFSYRNSIELLKLVFLSYWGM